MSISSHTTRIKQEGFSKSERDFIQTHLNDDVNKLLLKTHKNLLSDHKKLIEQIASRQKAKKKLPEWSANHALIFPPVLSIEQCSSEATAKYKASLIAGKALIDITGGMGIDCYYMSKGFEQATYFEMNETVADAAEYNFQILEASNITVHAHNSIDYLSNTPCQADWIFADPARRGSHQEKVVLLSDCTPDILHHLSTLFNISPQILLKTSPLLDIDLAIKQLKFVSEVHVIGYESECKELLFILNKNHTSENVRITSVILNASGEIIKSISFTKEQEVRAAVSFSAPRRYLYEPHASILKSGAFKILGTIFDIHKLSPNSHLYTSDVLIAEFPGRSFEITAVCKPDSKEIAKRINTNKANLTIRNFPATIQELRKKLRIKEGGAHYLFATTLNDTDKVIIITEKPKKE